MKDVIDIRLIQSAQDLSEQSVIFSINPFLEKERQIGSTNYSKDSKNSNNIHCSTKRTPMKASKNPNENEVYNNIKDERKRKPNLLKKDVLVRVSNLR